jgi:hypothetical protein
MSLRPRIAAAERSLRLLSPGLRTICIRGGMTADSSGDHAMYGDVQLVRREDESVQDFRARAQEGATASGARLLVFGGLRINQSFGGLPTINVNSDD